MLQVKWKLQLPLLNWNQDGIQYLWEHWLTWTWTTGSTFYFISHIDLFFSLKFSPFSVWSPNFITPTYVHPRIASQVYDKPPVPYMTFFDSLVLTTIWLVLAVFSFTNHALRAALVSFFRTVGNFRSVRQAVSDQVQSQPLKSPE